MVDVHVEGSTVTFEVRGLHKLWALKGRIEARRRQVAGARHDPSVARGCWKGWRMPGTHVPGLIIAGTFYLGGERVFWDVRDASRAVVVELDGHAYDRLVIEVEDPAAVVAMLTAAG